MSKIYNRSVLPDRETSHIMDDVLRINTSFALVSCRELFRW
jgi:hypothetical protein